MFLSSLVLNKGQASYSLSYPGSGIIILYLVSYCGVILNLCLVSEEQKAAPGMRGQVGDRSGRKSVPVSIVWKGQRGPGHAQSVLAPLQFRQDRSLPR